MTHNDAYPCYPKENRFLCHGPKFHWGYWACTLSGEKNTTITKAPEKSESHRPRGIQHDSQELDHCLTVACWSSFGSGSDFKSQVCAVFVFGSIYQGAILVHVFEPQLIGSVCLETIRCCRGQPIGTPQAAYVTRVSQPARGLSFKSVDGYCFLPLRSLAWSGELVRDPLKV